jgi:cystathionine beta-lyase
MATTWWPSLFEPAMVAHHTTGLIHHPYQPPTGFDAVSPAVHKASTVIFADTAALRARSWQHKAGYTYGLHGTPTTFVLEERIAALEGGTQTLLTPSGLAAIAVVDLGLLKAGDFVLIPDNAYGPGKELAKHELAGWGIQWRSYEAMRPESLAEALASTPATATRLVWLEAAGSVTMEFPDLPALVAVARHAGAITALDNTWGAGLAFCAFDFEVDDADGLRLGADISVHALTKYPSGGGDVLMGAVTTRNPALHLRMKGAHMRLGWGVAANDVEFILRSLPTVALRYAAHDRAARQLARWWQGRREVVQVLHPALEGAPGHAHWRSMCGERDLAAGLFSVVFDASYTAAQVDAFVDALRLYKIGFSWAGPVSLVVPYELRGMRDAPTWPGTVVRFSVGLEAVADLIADTEQALQALN